MTTNHLQAILNHLQASEILEVREWAKVLWVKAIAAGRVICRFVSKKIGETMDFLSELKKDFLALVEEQFSGASEKAIENTWKSLLRAGTGEGTYSDPHVSAESAANGKPLEFFVFAQKIEQHRNSLDGRTKTERRLDSMYGRGGWSNSDREDYEG